MPIPTKLSELDSGIVRPYVDAFAFTINGAGTFDRDYKIPVDMVIVRTSSIFNGQALGDYVQIQSIDIDNVLGFGANFVVAMPVIKAFINPAADAMEEFSIGYPIPAKKDLYLRIKYTTSNILASINGRVNVYGHKLLYGSI